MQNRIRAIAFDIDGTLYPNRRMRLYSLPFLTRHFFLVWAFAQVRRDIRLVAEIEDFRALQTKMLAQKLGCSPEAAARRLNTFIYGEWEGIFKRVKPYGGVVKALENLKARGYKLGVLSDFPVGRKLEYFHLESWWDVVMSSEDCGYLKPSCRPFMSLARALDCKPEEVLYVGNNHAYDICGAAAAGMKTVYVNWRGRFCPPADRVVRNYRDFVNKIDVLLGEEG